MVIGTFEYYFFVLTLLQGNYVMVTLIVPIHVS